MDDTDSLTAATTSDPCDGITGTLTTSKTTIDRRTASLDDAHVRLSWEIALPPTCDLSVPSSISGIPIPDPQGGNDGFFDLLVERTQTFQLRANGRTLDSVLVTVLGDPGNVSISAGPTITQADLDQFDAVNMQRYVRERTLREVRDDLFHRRAGRMWEVFDVSSAMVRMFELTNAPQYAAHLHAVSRLLLPYRDDMHPGADPRFPDTMPPAIDVLRGQATPLPAWGGSGIASAGLYAVGEPSLAYMYSIAANARVVLENPTLRAAHGPEVIADLVELLDTEHLFAAQIVTRNTASGLEAKLVKPNLARVPTHAECDAYLAEQEALYPDEAGGFRFETQHDSCKNMGLEQGAPLPYNYRFMYMAALTELWRALDTPVARASIADPRAAALRSALPVRISRMLNYFKRRVSTDVFGANLWNYNDEVPTGINTHIEDASHGSLDMFGFDEVRRNMARLNTVAAPAGEPLLPLSASELARYAKTVTARLITISTNPPAIHLAEDLSGRKASPIDKRNGTCDGWVNFAESNRAVYDACYDITFRVVDGGQPYLNLPAYVSLLKNKRWLPSPPPPPPPPPANTCKATQKCCEEDADGGCLICIPRGASCP